MTDRTSSKPDYVNDPKARRTRRIRYALFMGFGVTFTFALMIQLVADGVSWLLSTPVPFMFPLGLAMAWVDPMHIVNVVLGLSMIALGLAVVFYLRLRAIEERPSIVNLAIHERGGRVPDGSSGGASVNS